jgi:hypothetical protein
MRASNGSVQVVRSDLNHNGKGMRLGAVKEELAARTLAREVAVFCESAPPDWHGLQQLSLVGRNVTSAARCQQAVKKDSKRLSPCSGPQQHP